jgi:hypothetical protein
MNGRFCVAGIRIDANRIRALNIRHRSFTCRLFVFLSCRALNKNVASGFFVEAGHMNYQAFTDDSLTMMYEAVRGALAADDALRGQGEEPRFRIRETPDWKTHAADLESEMLNRGMFFEVIDWSENPGKPSFEQ